jgi:hypothetical protein
MFKIIGADQKEYGPVSTEQIRQWIRDGRLNAATKAQREGGADWQPLSAFEEFADVFNPPAAAPMPGGAPAPMAAPSMSSAPMPTASREMALSAVKGPAIALIIVASMGIAYYLFVAIYSLALGGAPIHLPPNTSPQLEAFLRGSRGPLAGVFQLFFAGIYGFILFGALRMLKLQGHTLAIIACIVAMLPCGCCCIFGLPFGIWGLVVLNKPEVKSQFTN